MTVSFTLKGGAAGSHASSMAETISIQNTNNSSIALHVYDYTDFDLAGTNGGDTVSFPTTNVVVQQGKGVTATQSVHGQTPSFWEASWYALNFDKINGTSPAILSDTNTPSTPGDQTFAYQWDVTLGAGQTFTLNLTNNIQMGFVRLTIALSGANVILSWPTSGASGLKLQSGTSLNSGSVWTDVATPPATVGASYQVTIPLAGSAQFYRLRN